VRTIETYERIKEVRKNNKLTQSEFAEKLGVTRSVIANIELNRLAKPEQKTSLIKLISREFNVSENWLLEGNGAIYTSFKDDEKIAKLLAEISLSKNEKLKELIQKMMKLDDKYINSILTLIDGIIESKK